jgi:acyl carrier protein
MQTTLQLSDEAMARVGLETTPLMLPEWNSMAHVQLILELERTFDVAFDADAIASMASVGAIVAVLDRRST